MPGSRRTPTVVITGISGRLGRMLARDLRVDHRVLGVDPRGAGYFPQDITVHSVDIRRKKAEDIFRRNRVDAVIHINATPNWGNSSGAEHHNRVIMGSRRLLEYCQRYEVPKLIFLSTALLYGANPDNNQFLTEEAPLLAGYGFPSLRDLVEADMYASNFFWKHPEIDTVVLRPVQVVGRLSNTASIYFSMNPTPTLMGFDPMMQVMAAEDLLRAIRLAMKPGIRGVFNIAGPKPAPLSELIRLTGHKQIPIPDIFARTILGAAFGVGIGGISTAHLNYLKYVCMADDTHAREVLRYEPSRSLADTLRVVA